MVHRENKVGTASCRVDQKTAPPGILSIVACRWENIILAVERGFVHEA